MLNHEQGSAKAHLPLGEFGSPAIPTQTIETGCVCEDEDAMLLDLVIGLGLHDTRNGHTSGMKNEIFVRSFSRDTCQQLTNQYLDIIYE